MSDSVATILGYLLIPILFTVFIGVLAMRNKVLFRMGIRNLVRRKTNTAIIICGLMIGTAIISGSLIVGDTLENLLTKSVYDSFDETDETAFTITPEGTYAYFDEEVYDDLNTYIEDEDLDGIVEDVSPEIRLSVSVFNRRSKLSEAGINLFAFEHSESETFGKLHPTTGGSATGEELAPNEVYVNRILSDELDIGTGNKLVIFYGRTWNYNIDTTMLPDGEHTIHARAWDGFNYSIEDVITVWVSNNGTLPNFTTVPSPDDEQSLFGPSVNILKPQDYGVVQGTYNIFGTSSGETDLGITVQVRFDNGTEWYTCQSNNGSAVFTVKAVVEFDGRAAFGMVQGIGGMSVFMELDTLQGILGVGNRINFLRISNVGDKFEGLEHSGRVAKELEPFLQEQEIPLILVEDKKEGIDNALEGSRSLTELFLILGSFSIIAGVMLVINIFVMLAEERKGEMGIQRAIGLRAKLLMYTFLFEGAFLAVFAALIGVFVGVLVAYSIILAFSNIFIGSEFPIMEYFTFSGESLALAFSAGLMITFLTIIYASWKVSKLNIIRAIRNIPEPRYSRHEVEKLDPSVGPLKRATIGFKDQVLRQYEVILIVLGLILMADALFNTGSSLYLTAWAAYAGLSISLLGLTLLLRRWMIDERAFTIGGFLILGVWSYPWGFFTLFDFELTEDPYIWINSGIFMVMGALFIVIYNNSIILSGLIKVFGRFKSIVPVFKTAISYPMSSKFRTGMTLAMFTLIIFVITTTAMIISQIEGNIDQMTEEQAGGYHMIGYTNPNTPISNIEGQIDDNETLELSDFKTIVPLPRSYSVIKAVPKELNDADEKRAIERNLTRPFNEFEDNGTWYSIIGCTEQFFDESDYELDQWDKKEYPKYQDAWRAVEENHSLAIVDHSIIPEEFGPPVEGIDIFVGSYVVVRDAFGHAHSVKIVGIMKQGFFINGIFVNSTVVNEEFDVQTPSLVLFKFRDGLSEERQDRISKDVESAFVANGMQTVVIKKVMEDQIAMIKNFFYLLEAFIGLGLVVGIAGLGIITIRSVTERRQQIGMLRAIGFKRNMILKSFLIESSFIALMGIVLGVGLGIILGYALYIDFEAARFVIPWDVIIAVGGISYFFTFFSTVSPARRAAKVAPAEALRYLG